MRLIKQYIQLFLLTVTLGLIACENKQADIDKYSVKKMPNIEEANKVNTLFSQGGRLKAILQAPRMLRYLGDSTVVEFPKSMHVDFYDSLGTIESWVDARFARYVENRSRVLLRDSVQVINRRGDTLRTPELWWDQNAHMFYTDSVVRIVQQDKRIRGGRGMEAGQDLSWYLIKQPTGTVMVADDKAAQ